LLAVEVFLYGKYDNMKRPTSSIHAVLLLTAILIQSCGIYDLRTKSIKNEGITTENANKGKEILERAWKKQGYDKLSDHKVYAYHGSDTWKGALGKMGQIWPDMKAEMDFKYQIGTFDGQVTFVDGKQSGDIAGLQNWNYYEISKNDTLFKDEDHRQNRRMVFGIAAFQYFTEMVDRIRNAPIISYAGQDEMRGQAYDLVFCTWGSPEPHMAHDQYMAWINKNTGMMDFTQYTLRESYLKPPGYKMIGGGVEFTDFREIGGTMIPHEQLVYAIKLKKNPKRNLHRLIISDFEFDGFAVDDLRVDQNIEAGGDFKN
jgi:hypothetical protein